MYCWVEYRRCSQAEVHLVAVVLALSLRLGYYRITIVRNRIFGDVGFVGNVLP